MSKRAFSTEELARQIRNYDLLAAPDNLFRRVAKRLQLLQKALDATALALDGKCKATPDDTASMASFDPRLKVLQICVFENSIVASQKAREALAAHEREP
jgi:hypothetical protein